jgi:hypothetical protein
VAVAEVRSVKQEDLTLDDAVRVVVVALDVVQSDPKRQAETLLTRRLAADPLPWRAS